MSEEEQEKLYELLFKDTKNKLEETIEEQQNKIASLKKQIKLMQSCDLAKVIKKQEKEIEDWQKAYIKENNYWLKFRNKINKIANNDKDCSDNEVIKAVKNLNKENDKLTKLLLGKSLGFNDYISKDKINDKIKEYQNKLFQDVEENKVVEYENIIQVLEELLEENNKCK